MFRLMGVTHRGGMMSDEPQAKPDAEGSPDEIEEVVEGDAEGLDEAAEPNDDEPDSSEDQQGEDEAGPAREVARQPSRGQRQFGAVREENRELRARIAETERLLAQLTQQQRQPSAAEIAAQERQEAEAVSMMAPAEVARYYSQKSEQKLDAALRQTQFQLWNQSDTLAYQTELARDPSFAKYDDRVQELARQYPTVSRIDLLDKAMGEAARKGISGARTRARNRSAQATERQTVRPPANGRGDVAGSTERGGGNRWDRLRDVQI